MSAITVENLSKRYIIGHETRTDTLRDALTGGVSKLWRRLRARRTEREEFWALRDVSFSVVPGEVVGIIGRNGAGKSTLLKILSRITEPTTGRISIRGRVASLLEVGTGFHPELSGRENIFLNGAILGMSRVEIRKKFDEIVAFSEVERFLDTPVKRYSSGMYVRLAFAVAAHLEPEILIVDEVLAVGDAQFQKKCLGKMQDVARSEGRTIFFVSHNLGAVKSLCQRVLLLEKGRVAIDAEPDAAIARHLDTPAAFVDPGGTGPRVSRLAIHAAATDRPISPGDDIDLEVGLRSLDTSSQHSLFLSIYDEAGVLLSHFCTRVPAGHADRGIRCRLQKLPLNEGSYLLNVTLANDGGTVFSRAGAARFEVVSERDGPAGGMRARVRFPVLVRHDWLFE